MNLNKTKSKEKEKKEKTPPPIVKDTEGREVTNPIPLFISKTPWYLEGQPLNTTTNYNSRSHTDINSDWYARGTLKSKSSKYRKGACNNCGSISHKTKDCLDRPRLKGAKFSGKDLKGDEVVVDVQLNSFEGKRDRWNGYNPDTHLGQIKGV